MQVLIQIHVSGNSVLNELATWIQVDRDESPALGSRKGRFTQNAESQGIIPPEDGIILVVVEDCIITVETVDVCIIAVV